MTGLMKRAVGVLGLSALASACCWLPMLLLALGLGTAGMGSFFAPLHLPLSVLTVVLLGWTGWWFYGKRPRKLAGTGGNGCRPGSCCTGDAKTLLRRQHLIFWLATAVVLALLAFPWYAPSLVALTSAAPGQTAHLAPARQTLSVEVGGMTCDGCAALLETRLKALDRGE